MVHDIECSMKTAGELKRQREEQMLVLMHMGDDLYRYEEPDTALLCRILDALHDLMKGIDTCQRFSEIKSEYDCVTKELEARGVARREICWRGLFRAPLILILSCKVATKLGRQSLVYDSPSRKVDTHIYSPSIFIASALGT